ncbi:N-acetylmuramoyl-L-alanine amidase [Orenia metallireducens]|uniref:Spore cortex-lytic enzyme n=1 Tax=Orenia metallireducens TaxID=1413210 RepID=A0A285FL05_9FIRM|nr:spore cortex-lytic enzyme [Orenia metallireducens]PRX33611.1 N-acetylmuramoyl-L-alanine amidase [Orenia metallireducens]SNY11960.1 N-acetylmuramoyl-L-alanine amidase [Orenia metallireducens]
MKNGIIMAIVVAMVLLIGSSIIAEAYTLGSRTLMFGKVGEDVKDLQIKLNQWGYNVGAPDGIYGKGTEKAVIKFQKDQGLVIDGIAGRGTIDKLKAEKYIKYSVKAGDNLSKIANKFNTTVWKIKVNNNLYTDVIYVGEKLNIPQAGPNTTSAYTFQSRSNYRLQVTAQELDWLTRAVYSEARGEPYKGQVAVAAVILNRVLHPRFPNTIKDVIFEPWAFTAVHDGQFWLEPKGTARQAVIDALKGWDPTGGATFYYNPVKVTSYWIYTRPVITQIGRHYFAT